MSDASFRIASRASDVNKRTLGPSALRCVAPYMRSLSTLPRNDFELHRGSERTERKACDAINQAARVLLFSEDVLQQLRSGVRDFRLFADISRSGHRHAEPDDPRHFVERSQMLPSDGEDIERCEVNRLAPSFHFELRSDAPNEFRRAAFRGKHPRQKKQYLQATPESKRLAQ